MIHSRMIRTHIHLRVDRTSTSTLNDETPWPFAASVVDDDAFGSFGDNFDHPDRAELRMYKPVQRRRPREDSPSYRAGARADSSRNRDVRKGCSQPDIPAEQNSSQ